MKTRLYTLFVALTVLALLGSQWKAESFAASVQDSTESENEREALTDDEGQEERSSEFEDEFDFDEEEGVEDESEETFDEEEFESDEDEEEEDGEDDEDGDNEDEEHRDAIRRYRELRLRIGQIEVEMERAEKSGEEKLLEELEVEAKEVFMALEEMEEQLHQDDDSDEDEDEEEWEEDEWDDDELSEEEYVELEEHRFELGVERAELEAQFGRLEMIRHMADIARDPLATSAYAIMHLEEFMEPERGIDFLMDLQQRTDEEAIQRLIRIKLAELHAVEGNEEAAIDQLRRLILIEE